MASAFGVFRPDLVRGVALLSVPYIPRGDVDQLTAFTELDGPNNYQVFFQEPGGAKAVTRGRYPSVGAQHPHRCFGRRT